MEVLKLKTKIENHYSIKGVQENNGNKPKYFSYEEHEENAKQLKYNYMNFIKTELIPSLEFSKQQINKKGKLINDKISKLKTIQKEITERQVK